MQALFFSIFISFFSSAGGFHYSGAAVNPYITEPCATAPDTVLIQQSDRSKLHVICDGNLIISYCETIDGYTLVLDPIGMYEYAARGRKGDLVPMGLPAKDEGERSAEDVRKLKRVPKHLRYTGKTLEALEAKQKKANEDPAILQRYKKHQ